MSEPSPESVLSSALMQEFATTETPAATPAPTPGDDFASQFDEDNFPATTDEPIKTDTPETVVPEKDKPDTTATPDEDEIPDLPPGKASEAATSSWKRVKSKLKETEVERDALKARYDEDLKARDTELEQLRRQVAELPELSERAKYADEAEQELAISRVESTKEYKDVILKPMDAIAAKAEAIAKANDLSKDDVLDALAERDYAKQREMLKEILTGVDSIDQVHLVRMAEDLQGLFSKQDEMRSRAFEARKELEARNQEKETATQKQRREEFEGEVKRNVEDLKKKVPFFELAQGETLDGVFGSVLDKAKALDFDAAPANTKAFAAASGYLLPRVVKQFLAVQKENGELKARIAASNSSRPSVNNEPAPPAADKGEFGADLAAHFGIAKKTGFLG